MGHLDAETLSLLALAENIDDPGALPHLRECDRCRADLAHLTTVVATGRALTEADYPVAPGPQVWAGIEAELSAANPSAEAPHAEAKTTGHGTPPLARARDASTSPGEDPSRGRPRRAAVLTSVAAAVLGLALGVAGTVAVEGGEDSAAPGPESSPAARVSAAPTSSSGRALLAALPGHSAEGSAQVLEAATGRQLQVTVDGLPDEGDFFEVWLLDENAERLVSLGVLDGSSATLTLPPTIDLDDFPLVDISVEQLDGDPTHSADSVARGSLT